jgi:hypothetical protein
MWDYLGVLISIILGLALTHLLRGWGHLIQMRGKVKIYWVQVVWSLNVIIYVMAIWWGMYWWKHLQVWTIEQFFFLAGYAIVLFMVAFVLGPMEPREGLDFEAFFFEHRRWFFGLQILALLIDIPETLGKGVTHLRDVPKEYIIVLPALIGLCVVGLISRNRRVHAVVCLAFLAVLVSYLTFTTLQQIAVRG